MPNLHDLPLPPLSQETAIAQGRERLVFDWPARPDLLLKVARTASLGSGGARPAHRIPPLFRREERSWRAAKRMAQSRGQPVPLAEIVANVPFEQGVAQVVRKITDGAGNLAPTLADLVQSGTITSDHLTLLNAFVGELHALAVVVYDAKATNIVLDCAPDTQPRFVLVDGYGDRALIPLKTWIKPLARRRLARALARTARETGLAWDAGAGRFSFPPDQPPANGAASPHNSRTRASRPQPSR
jgi:hypothetical protein